MTKQRPPDLELECVHCGGRFNRPAYKERSRRRMGWGGPYCTTACARRAQRNRLSRLCGHCAARVTRPASSILRTERRGGTVYCSHACNGAARREDESVKFDRLWRKDGVCHRWLGATQPSGHGCFNADSGMTGAHRFAFERHHGRIVEEGKELHHTCDNPGCVNPEHLAEVTRREHMEIDGRLGALRTDPLPLRGQR